MNVPRESIFFTLYPVSSCVSLMTALSRDSPISIFPVGTHTIYLLGQNRNSLLSIIFQLRVMIRTATFSFEDQELSSVRTVIDFPESFVYTVSMTFFDPLSAMICSEIFCIKKTHKKDKLSWGPNFTFLILHYFGRFHPSFPSSLKLRRTSPQITTMKRHFIQFLFPPTGATPSSSGKGSSPKYKNTFEKCNTFHEKRSRIFANEEQL